MSARRNTAATAAKNQGAKALKDTVEALGPDAVAVADALWAVHCAALYTHREQPSQARVYFAYDRLLKRNTGQSVKRVKANEKTAA